MRRINIYNKTLSESIFDDSNDKLIHLWYVCGNFFDDVDVLMAIIYFFDQVAEVEGLEVLFLLVEIAWIVPSVLSVYSFTRKDKSFVVVMRLLVHIIIKNIENLFYNIFSAFLFRS